MINKKKILLICLLLIFVSFDISFAKKTPSPITKYKSCMSNIRVLMGAVEMYNMDNSVMMDDITEDDLKKLYEEKYLKQTMFYPECKYLASGKLSSDGEIYCKYHGGLDRERFPPSYDYLEKEKQENSFSNRIKKAIFRILDNSYGFGESIILLIIIILAVIGIRLIEKVIKFFTSNRPSNN